MGNPDDDIIVACPALEIAIDRHMEYYGDGDVGTERSELQLMEECAELIQAVSHHRRGRVDVMKVLREMADVFIQIQLALVVNGQTAKQLLEEVAKISNGITKRLDRRIAHDGTALEAAEYDAKHPEEDNIHSCNDCGARRDVGRIPGTAARAMQCVDGHIWVGDTGPTCWRPEGQDGV